MYTEKLSTKKHEYYKQHSHGILKGLNTTFRSMLIIKQCTVCICSHWARAEICSEIRSQCTCKWVLHIFELLTQHNTLLYSSVLYNVGRAVPFHWHPIY